MQEMNWNNVKEYSTSEERGRGIDSVVRDILDIDSYIDQHNNREVSHEEEEDNVSCFRDAELTEMQWDAVKARCKKRRRYGRGHGDGDDGINDDDEGDGGYMDGGNIILNHLVKKPKIDQQIIKREIKDEDKEEDEEESWRRVAVDIDSKAPCLISSYHSASNYSTKFIFNEFNGVERGNHIEGKRRRPRFFTLSECCKLMGFPKDFIPGKTDDKTINTSSLDSLRPISEENRGHFYKQIGNAVCPPVVEAVTFELLKTFRPPS